MTRIQLIATLTVGLGWPFAAQAYAHLIRALSG